MLCLRRTLSRGIAAGLVSALGIFCAYAFWSYAAIHGLTSIADWIAHEKNLLEMTIGLFFMLYGLNGIINTPKTDYPTLKRKGGFAEFLSTFLVVFLNPGTLVMFSAVFALIGIPKKHVGMLGSLQMAGAVFAGSVVFWLVMALIIHKVRQKFDTSVFYTVARLSSWLIMVFGVGIIFYFVFETVL